MPRSTKNSRASASTGDERDQPLVLSGEEDGVAPPPRIPPEVKERLRQMQQECTLSMYDHAVAYFKRSLQTTKTEGVGDCWLLSIMGGFEVKDPKLVKEVNDAQRRTICTARRLAIVDFAASSKRNGSFRLLCEMCRIEVDVKDKDSVKNAEGAIAKRLQIWRTAQHYGKDQELMHPCAGWYFRRNILVIDTRENVLPSYCALNATPCPLVPSSRNS
jgi:hypothetical protein